MKFQRNLLIALFIGTLSTQVQAYPFTINADAPTDFPGIYTDYCIQADGGGPILNGFGSSIIHQYEIDLQLSSHDLYKASVGFQDDELGGIDTDGLCFYFPFDPVLGGETFSVVIDATWLDGTEQSVVDGTETFGLPLFADGVWSSEFGLFGATSLARAVGGINPDNPLLLNAKPFFRMLHEGCGPGCISLETFTAVPLPPPLYLLGLGLIAAVFSRRPLRSNGAET